MAILKCKICGGDMEISPDKTFGICEYCGSTMTLPKVRLLDPDFIDETRTKAFYESGRWSAADREALYNKARRQMMAHALIPQNLQTAADNADVQLRRMMRAMGYKTVIIRFEAPHNSH